HGCIAIMPRRPLPAIPGSNSQPPLIRFPEFPEEPKTVTSALSSLAAWPSRGAGPFATGLKRAQFLMRERLNASAKPFRQRCLGDSTCRYSFHRGDDVGFRRVEIVSIESEKYIRGHER